MGAAKGQVSVEYLIIIGVVLGLMVPGVLFFYGYTQSNSGSSANSRLTQLGLDITSTAKSTYGLGTGARQTLEATVPDNIIRIYASGTELVFVYDTPHGQSEAVFFSQVTLNGTNPDGTYNADGNISTHPGLTRFRLTSAGNTVNINELA
jgi:uncharacterized protein (UPF0333 family)